MNYKIQQANEQTYLEILPDGWQLASEQEALELVALCGEHSVERLLLPAACLPADFFDLSSGLAGIILLRFVIYRLKAAALLTPDLVNRGKFRDFALETNRGQDFRIFYERAAAEAWLGKA